jgi:PAS domain S-box-containing protein
MTADETTLRAILDATADGIVAADAAGAIRFANPAAERMFQYPAGGLPGATVGALIPALLGDGGSWHAGTGPAAAGGRELVGRRADGTTFPVELTAREIRLTDRRIYAATVRDITDRKRAEAELAAATARMRLLLDSSGEGIYGIDTAGRCTFANQIAADMVGWEPAEMVGRNMHDLFHHTRPDGAAYPECECPIYRAIQEGSCCRVADEVFWHRSGAAVPVEYSSTAMTEGSGTVGAVVTFRDIRARKRAEAALRASEERYRTLADNAPVGLFQANAAGGRVYHNRRWFELTGLPPDRAAGDGWRAALHPDDRDRVTAAWERVRADGGVSELEYRFVRTDGEVVWVLGRTVGLRDAAGAPDGYIGIVTDVTALKRAQAEAEAASRAKGEFLANMSHELRTPLNSVIGFANILTKNKVGNLRPQDLTYLERIFNNGKHLLALINQILDLSKVEAGKAEVHPTAVRLDHLVRETLAELDGQHRNKEVALRADLPAAVAAIESDAVKLKQVVINLVGNAIKFTERGSVTVRLAVRTGDHAPVCLEVIDTGIGIPADKLETVFQPFKQADSGTSRKYGGTGLGLTIARSLCDLLGFRVEVESRVGVGSTFRIILGSAGATAAPAPAAAAVPAPVEARLAAALGAGERGRLVLVIDDESDSRMLITNYLEDAGCRVIAAGSGAQGLRMAREFRPALITLDLMMPGMDGWQVLKELKESPDLQAIPVVVVSIVATEQPGALLGAVEVLDKPFTRESLGAILARTLHTGKGRILVVEDNPDVRELLTASLVEDQYEIQLAANGQEALRVLYDFTPDLIVLDLRMPTLDGWGFLEALQKDPGRATSPIVVLTAETLSAPDVLQLRRQVYSVLKKDGEFVEALKHTVRGILAPGNGDTSRSVPVPS